MVFFSDFGKVVTDLFKTKDYEMNRSLKLKCKSDNTEWSTESSFPISDAGQTNSKAKYKQTDETFGAITIEVPSQKPMKIDYETPGFVDGLKVNMICEYPKTSIEGEYAQGQNAAKFCVKATDKFSKFGFTGEVAREVKGLWVGGGVKLDGAELEEWKTGVSYTTSDTQLSLKTNTDVLQAHLHKGIEGGEVAALYDLKYKDNAQLVSVGGKWTLDDKSSVQGFVQSSGNTYLLYKHKLSSRCTAHLGTAFNMNGANDDVNVHYKFEFSA